MLLGFECDQDPTGWLAGLAVWTTGAAAGCLLAVAEVEPTLLHWQVLALAVAVSLVSLGLSLPALLSHCSKRIWLVHAVWMLAFFAQINWAGFLAARSANGTIAAEAMLICLGPEAWLLIVFVARGQLPWLPQLFTGNSIVISADAVESKAVNSLLVQSDWETHQGEQQLEFYREGETPAEPSPSSVEASPSLGNTRPGDPFEKPDDIRREFVDGIDENGMRYLSGSVRVPFEAPQRTAGFVLSFCPALEGTAIVELECDSEDVTANVAHATEIGARITVRRATVGQSAMATVDWYATATSNSREQQSVNLP